MTSKRVESFLACLPETDRVPMAQVEDLEQQLADLLAAARESWPRLAVPDDLFLGFIAERLPRRLPPERKLRDLHGEDLLLCCACLEGDEAARTSVVHDYLPEIEKALMRLDLPAHLRQEIQQTLRERLLLPQDSGPPLLSKYSGHGQLRRWIRATSINTALKILDRERRHVVIDEEQLLEIRGSEEDPELRLLKETYRAAFRAAFRQALAALPCRQRMILKQHFLDGLSIDQLGALYHVHRSTAARRLAKVKSEVARRTWAILRGELALEGPALESMMRLIESRLSISLGSLRDLEGS